MKRFLQQVGFALQGVQYFLKYERNARIQTVIMLAVVAAGLFFSLARWEWCVVLACCALVLSLEMVNTALERVCAMLSAEYHPMVKVIKDVAAAAVLWSAFVSATIGLLIFWPHLAAMAR